MNHSQPDFATPLSLLNVKRKLGSEFFHNNTNNLDFGLLEFWQWSSSNLVNNTLRGKLAEFLVAKALHIAIDCRSEWDSYDLLFDIEGKTFRIEVKSSAYLQSWDQTRYSTPKFSIAAARCWNASTNTYSSTLYRCADLYVFSFLKHRDKATVDPLDVSQWEFFVAKTTFLNEKWPNRKSVSLDALYQSGLKPFSFEGLARAVHACVAQDTSS